MKVTFDFNGSRLCLKLHVEAEDERAVARLMEGFNVASVSLDYGSANYYTDHNLKGVDIVLRRPEEK